MPHNRSSLILASASPRRAELLREAGVSADVIPSPLTEPMCKPVGVSVRAWVMALAYFKACAVGVSHPKRWILAADTIVCVNDELLNKPVDLEDARRMLKLQAGRASTVLTGVCLTRFAGPAGSAAADWRPERHLRVAQTVVWMRSDPAAIERYLDSGSWQGKAGAYGIQEQSDELIERIDGSYSNVVGLPIETIEPLLRARASDCSFGPADS